MSRRVRTNPDHPPRLDGTATLVVLASRKLTPAQKLVWHQHWMMDDGGPDACWMGPTSMAARLGMEVRTIEDYRTWLKAVGLLERIRRTDAKNFGWIPVLPAAAIPRSNRMAEVAGSEAIRLAGILDSHITARVDWISRNPDAGRAEGSPRAPMAVGVSRFLSPDTGRGVCAGEGGKGGALQLQTLERNANSTLPLGSSDNGQMQRQRQDGVVARDTERHGTMEQIGAAMRRMA